MGEQTTQLPPPVTTPPPAASPSAPAAPAPEAPKSPMAPARPRQPTADELKQTFTMDDAHDLEIQQLPPTKEKPLEPKGTTGGPGTKTTPGSGEGAAGERSEAERSDRAAGEGAAAPGSGVPEGMIMPPSKQAAAPQRDYTGFSAEEQAMLKQMSNPAFDFVSKMAKERKELEKLRGATVFQHPQGYILDPDFQKHNEDMQYANAEYRHWQAQLEKVKLGEKWTPLLKWDANGQPVYGAEQDPTGRDEEQIRLAMNQCMQVSNNAQAQAQQYVGNFHQRVMADNQAIMAEQRARFGWVADPKLLDEKLALQDGEKSIRDIKSEFIGLFPAYHRNSVAVDVAANLFVACIIQGMRVRQAEAGRQVAEVKTEEARRAEPTSAATRRPQGKAINGVTEFSLEGLPT